MERNKFKYPFMAVSFSSIATLVLLLLLFINLKTNLVYFVAIILMLFVDFLQLVRILNRKVTYKKWINSESPYTMAIFAIFLSIPLMIRFSLSTGIIKYIALSSLFFIIIVLFGFGIRIIMVRNSFYNTLDDISFSMIMNILEKRNIKYKNNKLDSRLNPLSPKKDKEIYLIQFKCKIFKTKRNITIQPRTNKMKSVYEIIDIIEEENKR